MSKADEMVGGTFNMLEVLRVDGRNKDGRSMVIVMCRCGTKKRVNSSEVRRGNVKSCGCLRIDANATHGKSKTLEHYIWIQMRGRCYNKNNKKYKDYGLRGITVCDRWRLSFECFLADMGEKPGPEYSVDRIDNDGPYSAENCRWATPKEQSSNTRKRKYSGKRISSKNTIGITGVRYREKYGRWDAAIQISRKANHLGTFDNLLDAAAARKSAELKFDKLRGRA